MTASIKQAYDLMLAIYRRAFGLGLTPYHQITHMIDIDTANSQFHLRLNEWLKADDLNFSYDFCGICDNMNRTACKLEGQFVPRFAGEWR